MLFSRRAFLPALVVLLASLPMAVAGDAPAVTSLKTASAETAAIPDDAVLARVNGEPVTMRDVRLATIDLADKLPRVSDDARLDYVLSYLIDMKLGSRAALERKLDLAPDFARKAAYNREKLLLDELLAAESSRATSTENARKTFEATLREVRPEQEVRARQILVDSEEKAKAALARLAAGEDFAAVATAISSDPGTARAGGDLGWFPRDRMAPEFSEMAFKLKPGEVSPPVKTQFGWHIIKVEERRTRPTPPFEDVRPEIDAYLARKAQQDLILKLRARAKIERLPPPPPAPARDKDAAAAGGATAPGVNAAAPAGGAPSAPEAGASPNGERGDTPASAGKRETKNAAKNDAGANRKSAGANAGAATASK